MTASTPYNLLQESWLPVRRRDGQRELIRPARITDDLQGNPIVSVDWPRAEFRIATLELLIGLLTTACPPVDEEAWLEGWRTPPSPEALAAAFAPLAFAFNLDGDGPRFMQDHDPAICGRIWPAQAMLLDSVAENAVTHGRTVFQKPTEEQRFCRAAAAIALYALQTYAPQGGSGNKVGLRGGTPMTLLVQPGGAQTLWHTLWANVPQEKRPTARDLPRVFPWLAPTRSNRTHGMTIPADAHRLQMFWAMPRRIQLVFADNTDAMPCDLLGSGDTVLVTAWRQEGGGPEYSGWTHPLSAYQQASPGGAVTALRGRSDVGYQQWVGWVFGDATQNTQRPAQVLTDWQVRATDLPIDVQQQSRILATGFVSSEGSVVDRIESEMPLPGFGHDTQPAAELARALVQATTLACKALSNAVAQTVRSRSFSSANLVAACWQETEHNFHRMLRSIPPDISGEQAVRAIAPEWLQCLRSTATELFRVAFPIVPGSLNATHVAQQWRWLHDTFNGFTPSGQRLFSALQLPLPSRNQTIPEEQPLV